MANLKEIRGRISSVQSTRQITSAMKMVSAAKLRRAQDAITQMRPYAEKLQEILSNLSSSIDVSENKFAEEREVKKILLVAISSNRGLCGGFNNNIVKQVNALMKQHPEASISVLTVGKKVYDIYRKTGKLAGAGYPSHPYEIYGDLSFANAAELIETAMNRFLAGKVDRVYLVYNSFKNAATQVVKTEQFLPIPAPEASEAKNATEVDYIFEPGKEAIVADLIPKSLKIQFYKALLDSHAAEHGARMTAMHQATENATELLRDLKLSYNKIRQASITNEILEIVAGAEALNG